MKQIDLATKIIFDSIVQMDEDGFSNEKRQSLWDITVNGKAPVDVLAIPSTEFFPPTHEYHVEPVKSLPTTWKFE